MERFGWAGARHVRSLEFRWLSLSRANCALTSLRKMPDNNRFDRLVSDVPEEFYGDEANRLYQALRRHSKPIKAKPSIVICSVVRRLI